MSTDAAGLGAVKIERVSAVEVRQGDEIVIEIAGPMDHDQCLQIASHFKARFGEDVGVTVLVGGCKLKVVRPMGDADAE